MFLRTFGLPAARRVHVFGTRYNVADVLVDGVPAREVKDPAALAPHVPPAWKASEASWPTHEGTPMHFSGQMALPKTDVTSNFFSWRSTFFLFYAESGDRSVYKIFEQETHAQTAEEHYELEEQLYRDD